MKFSLPQPVNQFALEQEKHPLDYETLRDVIDLSLWASQLLLQNGAESQQIEETVHRLGTGLGCDWLDIFLSPNAIVITATSNNEFRTKVRRVVHIGVNLQVVAEVNALVTRVLAGELDRRALRSELERVGQLGRIYSRQTTALMVGLSCGAFSRLFGGDWTIFIVTFIASGCAMLVRQELQKRHFNAYLVVIVTAFVAACIASVAPLFHLSDKPQLALVSSVLLLVPGVPLINAIQDMMKGYLIVGISRGVTGGLIAACIALGLLLAMSLLRISGL